MSNVEGVTAEELTVQDSVNNTNLETPEVNEDTANKVDAKTKETPTENEQDSLEEVEVDYKSEYTRLKAEKLESDTKIKRQTAANRATQERYEEALKEIETLKVQPLEKPAIDSFDTEEEYDLAVDKYNDELVDINSEIKAQEIIAKKAQAEKFTQAQTSFVEKEQVVIAENPDYQENTAVVQEYLDMIPKDNNGVIQDPGFQEFSKFLAFESENGPSLLNHLGKNPDLIEALLGKPPAFILRKLKAYEKELSVLKTPAHTTNPLPKPINKVKGSSTPSLSTKQLEDPEAYMKWRQSQLKKKRS